MDQPRRLHPKRWQTRAPLAIQLLFATIHGPEEPVGALDRMADRHIAGAARSSRTRVTEVQPWLNAPTACCVALAGTDDHQRRTTAPSDAEPPGGDVESAVRAVQSGSAVDVNRQGVFQIGTSRDKVQEGRAHTPAGITAGGNGYSRGISSTRVGRRALRLSVMWSRRAGHHLLIDHRRHASFVVRRPDEDVHRHQVLCQQRTGREEPDNSNRDQPVDAVECSCNW